MHPLERPAHEGQVAFGMLFSGLLQSVLMNRSRGLAQWHRTLRPIDRCPLTLIGDGARPKSLWNHDCPRARLPADVPDYVMHELTTCVTSQGTRIMESTQCRSFGIALEEVMLRPRNLTGWAIPSEQPKRFGQTWNPVQQQLIPRIAFFITYR